MVVVSHGDDALLRLGGRAAVHFPQNDVGAYAGYHPSDSFAAITQLEDLRAKGATHIVFPQTMFWWLGHYEELREHLVSRYPVVTTQPDSCVIFRLDANPAWVGEHVGSRVGRGGQLESVIDALLPDEALVAFAGSSPPGGDAAVRGWAVFARTSDPASDVSDADLCREVNRLQSEGISFLVVDPDAFDWLDDHPQLQHHLAMYHRLVTRQEHVCEIYELQGADGRGGPADV